MTYDELLRSVDEHDHRSAVVLHQSRAAALEKVDKATFSYVFLVVRMP